MAVPHREEQATAGWLSLHSGTFQSGKRFQGQRQRRALGRVEGVEGVEGGRTRFYFDAFDYAVRSRSELETTLTELNAIAALARMGLRRIPKAG